VRSKAGKSELNLTHGTKTKPDMQKTVSSRSPLCQSGRKSEDLWWERFVKEVGFELGVGSEGVIDDESGEFMEKAELVSVGRSESEMERLARGCRREAGS